MELSRNDIDKKGKKREEHNVVSQVESDTSPSKASLAFESGKSNNSPSGASDGEPILNPKPAFTLRTNSTLTNVRETTLRVWSDDAISRPAPVAPVAPVARVDDVGAGEAQWTIPFCLSSAKYSLAKDGTVSLVYDAVVHPDAVAAGERYPSFQEAVVSAALESVGGSKLDTYELAPLEGTAPFYQTVITRATFAKEKAAVLKEPEFHVKYLYGQSSDEEDSVFESRPTELVVEIFLPEMSSAKTVDLDVEQGKLSLLSTDPVSYHLLLNFFYPVDEEKGSAKFNRDNKRLVVHLPIKSVGLVLDHTSYEEEGMLHELVAHRNVAMEPQAIDEGLIMPGYSCHFYDDLMVLKLDVKNVLEESLEKSSLTTCKGSGLSLKFDAKENDNSNVYGKFGFDILFLYAQDAFEYSLDSIEIEIWDNNVIVQMALPDAQCKNYMVGLYPGNLIENSLPQLRAFKKKRKEAMLSTSSVGQTMASLVSDSETDSEKERHSSGDSGFSIADSESSLDADQVLESPSCRELEIKPQQHLQGILKRNRCVSESFVGHMRLSSSVSIESSIPEDGVFNEVSTSKKTVRFSKVVHRQVFRSNSSIVGQRQPRWKKTEQKKKRAISRSLSESDAQYLEFQELDPDDHNMPAALSKATSWAELDGPEKLKDKATGLFQKSESEEWDSGLASSSEDCNTMCDPFGNTKKGARQKLTKVRNVKNLANKYPDLKSSIF